MAKIYNITKIYLEIENVLTSCSKQAKKDIVRQSSVNLMGRLFQTEAEEFENARLPKTVLQ